MSELRLGDVIDDYCIKCRRVTNHSIVSIVNGAAAKVRCRTCYHDHDYRHEEVPPSKKDLKKAELLAAALAGGPAGPQEPGAEEPAIQDLLLEDATEEQAAEEPIAEETAAAVPEPELPIATPPKAQKKAPKKASKTARK